MRTRASRIEQEAVRVATAAGATALPIDLDLIARSLGVNVSHETLEDNVSGVLMVSGTRRYVLINEKHHSNRQRFSLAHELGHLVLHDSTGDRVFIDTNMRVYQRVGTPLDAAYNQPGSTTTAVEEREANLFASVLLMPSQPLREGAQGLDLSDESDVAYLARVFAVSDQAMTIRLQHLRLLEASFF